MKDQGRKKYMKILVLLMKFKADINASGREGLTALHHAATLGNSVMTQLLLDRGADPGIHSNSVRADTPLMVAAQHGNVTTMAKLAKARANIEDCDVSKCHFNVQFVLKYCAFLAVRGKHCSALRSYVWPDGRGCFSAETAC